MPVMTMLEFAGMTRALYERVGASLAKDGPPDGILYHACGPIPGGAGGDGWRIVDVWESPEAFDRFIETIYLPAVRACGGPPAPSRREIFATHHAGPVRR